MHFRALDSLALLAGAHHDLLLCCGGSITRLGDLVDEEEQCDRKQHTDRDGDAVDGAGRDHGDYQRDEHLVET